MDTSHHPSRRTVLTTAASAALVAVTAPHGSATPAPVGERGDRHRRVRTTVALPDGIRPEGITSGPGTTYYVGSLADGRIVTGDLLRGSSRTLWPGAQGRQVRGLYWDRRTGLVWAAGNVGAAGYVWAIHGRTGRVASETLVPDAGFLNDLVVSRGDVWVTDSRVDRLTRITHDEDHGRRRPTGSPRFLPLGGSWPAGDGAAINANGIRALPDGSLVLNNSRVGGLWQADATTGRVREITVLGGPGITGGDGLELDGSRLYNVRGSGQHVVSVLKLWRRDRHRWAATWLGERADDTLDVPSTATTAGGWLWAVNARFGVADPGTAEYWITRLRR